MDPSGMCADTGVPYNGATQISGTDCWEISLEDFVKNVLTPTNTVSIVQPLSAGCIGVVTCALYGGTCPTPVNYGKPEYHPGTTCYKARKGDVSIPEEALKKECGEGEEKALWAKQGVPCPANLQCWPEEGGIYVPPKGCKSGLPPYPPLLGTNNGTGHPNSGVFNYIWFVNGWYVYANHSASKGSPMVIKICKTIEPNDEYPYTMWCVTCKKKCKEKPNPMIPSPDKE
jgi:hypothetical protein